MVMNYASYIPVHHLTDSCSNANELFKFVNGMVHKTKAASMQLLGDKTPDLRCVWLLSSLFQYEFVL